MTDSQAQTTSQIRFHLDEKKVNALTWEEYEALELAQDGEMKMYRLRPLLARFVVNVEGKSLPHDHAMRAIGRLQMSQVADVIKAFMDALKDSTVPKGSGGSSSQPSDPSAAASPSLPG